MQCSLIEYTRCYARGVFDDAINKVTGLMDAILLRLVLRRSSYSFLGRDVTFVNRGLFSCSSQTNCHFGLLGRVLNRTLQMASRGSSLHLVIRVDISLILNLSSVADLSSWMWLWLEWTSARVFTTCYIWIRFERWTTTRFKIILDQLDGNLMTSCGGRGCLVKGVFGLSFRILPSFDSEGLQSLRSVVIRM